LFWWILGMFLLVVLVAVLTMGVAADWLAQHENANYVARNTTQQANARALAQALWTAQQQPQPPAGMQTLVERLTSALDVQILVVDDQNQVLADSLRAAQGRYLLDTPGLDSSGAARLRTTCAALVERAASPLLLAYFQRQPPCPAPFTILALAGTADADPLGVEGIVPARSERVILASAGDILVLAMLLGGGTACLLAGVCAWTLLRPLRRLTQAAQRLAPGNLGQRVPITNVGEIGTLGRAFNAMAAGLDRSEHLRRQLVSDIAHELRTPLATVQAYLDALQDGVLAPTPAVIASLQEESLLLGRLVADLQELSLAEAGQLSLDRQPMPLEPCIRTAAQALQARATARQVQLVVDLPRVLPWVAADRERVGQIVRNLLDNALQHTPAGGAIRVRATVLPQAVQVTIADTGAGIAAHHLPFLFERFYRVDPARSRKTGGTGLGLAIVQQLVQAQGGQVSVESTPGQGARFHFSLPIAARPDESAIRPGEV